MTKAKDSEHTLEDLERRRRRTLAIGTPGAFPRHRDKGELDVAAQIDQLLDQVVP